MKVGFLIHGLGGFAGCSETAGQVDGEGLRSRVTISRLVQRCCC